MGKLYREFSAYKEGYLDVSDLHEIFFEESGNKNGLPVILLHGGPGSIVKSRYRRFFNPEKYRIIMFDQRGCGKSKPVGEIRDNTTQDLIEDIEKLRKYLGIESWVVFGGSWGSTLALLYAETYPHFVKAIHLRGIFLCRQKDINWLFHGYEVKRLYPDLWHERKKLLKELKIAEGSLISGLYKVLTDATITDKKKAVLFFTNWEAQFMNVNQKVILLNENKVTEGMISGHKILIHYLKNNYFLTDDQLLQNILRLPKVPTVIIHGRFDLICPLEQAYELHKVIPYADFEIVPGAGHHSTEPGNEEKIVEYTDKFAELLT